MVVCDEWGDLFALRPGLGAHRLDSEDDLTDFARIQSLPMFLSILRLLEARGGRRWRRIEFDPCGECGGSGRSGEYEDTPSWERDEFGDSYLTSERVWLDCEACAGAGRRYRWGEEIDAAEILGRDAA